MEGGTSATYFKSVGLKKLASAAEKKQRRLHERAGRVRAISESLATVQDVPAQPSEKDLEEMLAERSSSQDLAATQCNTHKETSELAQKCARTAGLLCACLSSGIVTSLREVYGCESLSQRYLFVSALVQRYPELVGIVHDDACHLHKFTAARAGHCVHAARLAPPRLRYICDVFHMAGHIDPWCLVHCNPGAPGLSELVSDVRTSVCEFTFTWFSQYKYQSKHMSQAGFNFFLQEMCSAHNDCIFRGKVSHLTHKRSG